MVLVALLKHLTLDFASELSLILIILLDLLKLLGAVETSHFLLPFTLLLVLLADEQLMLIPKSLIVGAQLDAHLKTFLGPIKVFELSVRFVHPVVRLNFIHL